MLIISNDIAVFADVFCIKTALIGIALKDLLEKLGDSVFFY